jgi:putative transposase
MKPVPETAVSAVGETLREHGLAAPATGGGTTFLQAKTANEAPDLSPGIRAIASRNLPSLDRRGGRPMKHKRFSDEQVIGVLKEHEAGAKVDDICRRHAISTATFYSWRKKYAGMEASDAKRLRELEAENAKLKRIVADQVLDMSAMKELLGKHW